MGDGGVDLGVPAAALLVRQRAGVADARDDEAVADALDDLAVVREPADRPDRPGPPEKPVRVPKRRLPGEGAADLRQQCHARQVVVGQRRVARVGRQQDLVVRRAVEHGLAVGDGPGLERRVDEHPIVAGRERVEPAPAHAEPPALHVVRRAVRDEIRVAVVREDVLSQLVEGHRRVDRGAVVEDVEVRVLEVDDTGPIGAVDPGAPHAPLVRHDPVEHLGPRRGLHDLERHVARHEPQGLADAVAGDAPAEREHLRHPLVDGGSRRRRVREKSAIDRHLRIVCPAVDPSTPTARVARPYLGRRAGPSSAASSSSKPARVLSARTRSSVAGG